MPKGLIKIKDLYLEWSTIVDAPVSFGMTLIELKEYIKDRYGQEGLLELPTRLERLEDKGTSFLDDVSAEDTVAGNRSGEGEACLTLDEIYDRYCQEIP